ncbi:MAG: polyphosphate:AMP phosphotransferase, partial [Spirochaetia bacterium]|nr:polyphosphate:AMP phosphotransferase [Spirochaetia bacterium]
GAGKGSAIRRVTRAMDARLYSVIPVSAPTDEELAHHYLWRFWRRIPREGYNKIFDRSWYGRVLVERVEGFASEDEWKRAYNEINEFEKSLSEGGIHIIKFWIHIDQDEQLRRFKERENTPWKQYKITEDDWRNREKWHLYESAVNDMILRTNTDYAPWRIIPGNDKKFARIEIMKEISRILK